MSCERFREALAGHAAGAELDPAAAAHLAACDACADRLALQRRLLADVDAELERALAMTASPEFVAGVTARVRRPDARPAAWRPATVWIGLATAAALTVGIYVRAPVPTPSVEPPGSASAASPAAPMATARATAEHPIIAPVRREATRRPASRAPGRPVIRSAEEAPAIVEPGRALAIQRLRELMAEGRLDEKMLPPPVTPEAALAELTIAPLEVAELRVPDVEIGRRSTAAPERQ